MEFQIFEQKLQAQGYRRIAGIDEAGRGPLAGPVVAAAVVLNHDVPEGLADSKQLSEKRREALYEELTGSDCDYGVGIVEHSDIDKMNILQATVLAMKRAVGTLETPPEFLLVDGKYLPRFIYPARAITKGDARCRSIAAASILAKVTRDRIMRRLDPVFPQYGFARHKGYGTREHLDAIATFGPTPIHRLTFGGVREHLPQFRRERRALGKWGEDYTCLYLWKKGARIIQRNYHAGQEAELDIVAMMDGRLRFIEVKTGTERDFSLPDEWVDRRKEQKILKASEYFLYQHEEYQDIPCQLDMAAVKVTGADTSITYYENAF